VREYARDPSSRVVVLEYDQLEPCISSSCYITERTYIVHAHEMTWCNPTWVFFVRLYFKYHSIFHAAAATLLLFILTLVLCSAYKKARWAILAVMIPLISVAVIFTVAAASRRPREHEHRGPHLKKSTPIVFI